jgi:hypothetical protein
VLDVDAQLIRGLCAKYGFEKVVLELLRMADSYSAQSPRWVYVRQALNKAYAFLTGRKMVSQTRSKSLKKD